MVKTKRRKKKKSEQPPVEPVRQRRRRRLVRHVGRPLVNPKLFDAVIFTGLEIVTPEPLENRLGCIEQISKDGQKAFVRYTNGLFGGQGWRQVSSLYAAGGCPAAEAEVRNMSYRIQYTLQDIKNKQKILARLYKSIANQHKVTAKTAQAIYTHAAYVIEELGLGQYVDKSSWPISSSRNKTKLLEFLDKADDLMFQNAVDDGFDHPDDPFRQQDSGR